MHAYIHTYTNIHTDIYLHTHSLSISPPSLSHTYTHMTKIEILRAVAVLVKPQYRFIQW